MFGPYSDQRFGKPGTMQKRWARAPPSAQNSSTVLPPRPVIVIGNRYSWRGSRSRRRSRRRRVRAVVRLDAGLVDAADPIGHEGHVVALDRVERRRSPRRRSPAAADHGGCGGVIFATRSGSLQLALQERERVRRASCLLNGADGVRILELGVDLRHPCHDAEAVRHAQAHEVRVEGEVAVEPRRPAAGTASGSPETPNSH